MCMPLYWWCCYFALFHAAFMVLEKIPFPSGSVVWKFAPQSSIQGLVSLGDGAPLCPPSMVGEGRIPLVSLQYLVDLRCHQKYNFWKWSEMGGRQTLIWNILSLLRNWWQCQQSRFSGNMIITKFVRELRLGAPITNYYHVVEYLIPH